MMDDSDGGWIAPDTLIHMRIGQPEKSEWAVWLMGDYGSGQPGAIVYNPNKGQVPNWFHRKMQELCFGFQWRKTNG